MKMTKEEAFEMLKGRKVYVGEYSNEVQEKLFDIGFGWYSGGMTFNPCNRIIIGSNGTLTSSHDRTYFQCHRNTEISISQILNIELELECEFKQGDFINSKTNNDTLLDSIEEFNKTLDDAANNIKNVMQKAVFTSLISASVKKLSDDISKIKEIFNK